MSKASSDAWICQVGLRLKEGRDTQMLSSVISQQKSRCAGRRMSLLLAGALLLVSCLLVTACAGQPEKVATKVKVLLVPKFEVGKISGDFPGEAQLFYERYCAGCEEIAVPNSMPSSHFYMNEDNGVAMLITGEGKTAAGLSLSSLLSWDEYDFSDAKIISVGCGGANTGSFVYGDLIVATAVCDGELGYGTDSTELGDPEAVSTWFHSDAYDEYSCHRLNSDLCEKVYQVVKDCPMRTTETARKTLAKNFPDEQWASREPCVSKGTAVSADTYWKGTWGNADANYLVDYYGCPDKYAVCEMEDVAIMSAAKCFGLEDNVIVLRVIVNMDTFLAGESPESLWLGKANFGEMVEEESGETLDIFEPGMHNLFDVGEKVVDAILEQEL